MGEIKIKTPLDEREARRLAEDYTPGAFVSVQQRLTDLLLAVDAASRQQLDDLVKALREITDYYDERDSDAYKVALFKQVARAALSKVEGSNGGKA